MQGDVARHVLIEDSFIDTDIEHAFKFCGMDLNGNKGSLIALLEKTIELIKPQLGEISSDTTPVIIGSRDRGSRTLLALGAKALYPESFLVSIGPPKQASAYYDLVGLVPGDDDSKVATNKVLLSATPNLNFPEVLEEMRSIWAPRLRRDDRKVIAFLVGGNVGRKPRQKPFTVGHGMKVIDQVEKVYAEGFDVLLTTSRRTPEPVVQMMKDRLQAICTHSFFNDSDQSNPYKGYLACADALVVTPDSKSMISDAVGTKLPVFTVGLDGLLQDGHVAFHHVLRGKGRISELVHPVVLNEDVRVQPLNAAQELADKICDMIACGTRSPLRIQRTGEIISPSMK